MANQVDFKHVMAALRHCGRVRALKNGKSFHAQLLKAGCSHTYIYVANNLMSMYVDFSFLNDARKLFDEMPDKNIVTWTTIVSAYTSTGKPQEAVKPYTQMVESGSEAPNGFMYSVVLKACGLAGDIELGTLIHKSICKQRIDNDVVLMNSLLDMYIKCGSLRDARNFFDGILLAANSTSWNTIISGYCKEGLMEEAVHLFFHMQEKNVVSWNTIIAGFADIRSLGALDFLCKMHREGHKLDDFTLPCALKVCSYVGQMPMGKQIHCYILKSGFASSCFTSSALVDMYSNCQAMTEATKLFDQFSGSSGSIGDSLALWNSLLAGYVVNEQNIAAISMLSRIHHSGACMDSYTLSSGLKVCINLLNLRLGSQVHGIIAVRGYEFDYIVGSILIDLYSKLGNMKNAFVMFHRLPKKDIIAWAGLIMCCAKMGSNLLAFTLFKDMISFGLQVDEYVISSILKVCSSLASLASGKQVHSFCIKSGYETDGVTVTALISMYTKCGEIEAALALFDRVLERDVVCWTGIILGCGQNGRTKEALNFFQEMIQSGVEPNEVTFLGILTACRHAGLVAEARIMFESMKADYDLEPNLEHYYCMVDLLAQARYFKEAEKLIAEMPFKPDKTIWSSMLVACGTHKNTGLVRTIAENLLCNYANDPSIYVMLSNTYAMLGLWDELSKVREAAKVLGIKEAGTSWIELSNYINVSHYNPSESYANIRNKWSYCYIHVTAQSLCTWVLKNVTCGQAFRGHIENLEMEVTNRVPCAFFLFSFLYLKVLSDLNKL